MRLSNIVVGSVSCLVVICLAGVLMAATIDVSQPVQVTADSYYERGQSVVYDGTSYWLFYGGSASVTGNYDTTNPDTHDYIVYYKKSRVSRQAVSEKRQIDGRSFSVVCGSTSLRQTVALYRWRR